MRDGYLRGTLPRTPTARQVDVLVAFVAVGGSVPEAAARVGVRPSTAKRHLADLRARSGLAGYAVAGERQQGTLEPVLTTPIRREEFLVGKALAVLVPSAAIAYIVYALFLAIVVLFAEPGVASAIIQIPDILGQVLFTPLLGALSVWIGLAISTRASDVRVAQQLSLLGSLPLVLVTSLIAFNVIKATLGLAVSLAVLLLIADGLGWRVVSPLFNRERLVVGSK